MESDKVAPEIPAKLCRRSRLRKRQHFAAEMFREFTRNTGLHGLRYTTESGLSLVEKIFWTTTFLLSCGICFSKINDVWWNWLDEPVIVTINEQLVPIHKDTIIKSHIGDDESKDLESIETHFIKSVGKRRSNQGIQNKTQSKKAFSFIGCAFFVFLLFLYEIPFPSVTICPQMKCNQKKFNFTDVCVRLGPVLFDLNPTHSNNTVNVSDIDMQKLETIGLVCGAEYVPFYIQLKTKEKRNNSDDSIINDIFEVAPDPRDMFFGCTWKGFFFPCLDYFQRTLTSNGVCYSFNALTADEIFRKENIQQKYKYLDTETNTEKVRNLRQLDAPYYPYRGHTNIHVPDLQINLLHKEGDTVCTDDIGGFKIFLKHPSDMPQTSIYHYSVLPGQVSSVAVTADILNSSKKIVNYDQDTRECYLDTERYLKFFKIYTESNCRLECQTNYTYRECGCVWFHMPRNETMPICTIHQEVCMFTALKKMEENEIQENSNTASDIPLCRCRLSCESVVYDAEILKTNLGVLKRYKKNMEIFFNQTVSSIENLSRINVFFKTHHFISMRRSELFGLTELLANFGGLLGLFLGFSFMTFIELIYYGTLRLYCTLRRNKKRKEITATANEKKQ